MKAEKTFEIVEHIGVIAEYPSGWKKELNRVSWNGAPAKYDIRGWDEEHKVMTRGCVFAEDELKTLATLLNGIDIGGGTDEEIQDKRE